MPFTLPDLPYAHDALEPTIELEHEIAAKVVPRMHAD